MASDLVVSIPETWVASSPTEAGVEMATSQQRRQEPQIFDFLELPPEIRNNIYEHLFNGSTTKIISYRNKYKLKHIPFNGPSRRGLPTILQTNKQLRQEAIQIFYAETRFTAKDVEHLKHWLSRLDTSLRTAIRRLCVVLESDGYANEWYLNYIHGVKLGYTHAILRLEGLDMPGCAVEVRIVRRGTCEVLWPREKEARRT